MAEDDELHRRSPGVHELLGTPASAAASDAPPACIGTSRESKEPSANPASGLLSMLGGHVAVSLQSGFGRQPDMGCARANASVSARFLQLHMRQSPRASGWAPLKIRALIPAATPYRSARRRVSQLASLPTRP